MTRTEAKLDQNIVEQIFYATTSAGTATNLVVTLVPQLTND